MPTSTISSSISWGVYLAAAVSLVVILGPAVGGTSTLAIESGGSQATTCLAKVIEEIRPGMGVEVTLNLPTSDSRLVLADHTVVFEHDSFSFRVPVTPLLANATLKGSGSYLLRLDEGIIEVVPNV